MPQQKHTNYISTTLFTDYNHSIQRQGCLTLSSLPAVLKCTAESLGKELAKDAFILA